MDEDHDNPVLSSLGELQGTKERTIMDLVNKLRRIGLNTVLQLPQLVVCGDQSSGKSSVLEAISEIPFPRKENLCTRFATEVVMRDSPETSISAGIIPDKARPTAEQEKLRGFSESFNSFAKLADLYERAKRAMGLDDKTAVITRAFAADVLSIEISGPKLPQLTLVDLPGLIHSENKSQTDEDVAFIRTLVETYMSNKRTIILAVISAKNDYANQIVLKYCRKFDADGNRTLGIITKPDDLRPGSDNEKTWLDLARNRDIHLERGWHLLKNRADGESDQSFEGRNASEYMFFSQGSYQDLPSEVKGIQTLKTRLIELMGGHLEQEIPHLVEDLKAKLAATCKSLDELGTARSTLVEQRQFLTSMSMTAHEILKSGVNGNYESMFFEPVDLDKSIDAPSNLRRFRAVVQHLNIEFAAKMRSHGHKYTIAPHEASSETPDDSKSLSNASNDEETPKKLSRNEAIQWALEVLCRSRGRELPGTLNPLLIGQLFWEQSEPWEDLALAHINGVFAACRKFSQTILEAVVPSEVATRLSSLFLDQNLRQCLDESRHELSAIVADTKRHPMTYNHYFTTNLQKLRQERHGQDLARLTKSAKIINVQVKSNAAGPGYYYKDYIDPSKLEAAMKGHIEQDMEKLSAEELLDSLLAYYKDEMKFFIGAVTKQVIERHLVSPLPSLLSPMVVAKLSDDEIKSLASEPSTTVRLRKTLEERKAMLTEGKEAFAKVLMGPG